MSNFDENTGSPFELTNVPLEDIVLASMLKWDNVANELLSLNTTPKIFTDDRNRLLYEILLDMFESHKVIDTVTVLEHIHKYEESVKEKLLVDYYHRIQHTEVSSNANCHYYLKLLVEYHQRRKVIWLIDEVKKNTINKSMTINEMIVLVQKTLTSTIELNFDKQNAKELSDSILSTQKNKTDNILTHFDLLDNHTKGLPRGQIMVVGGRGGHSKTPFCLQVVINNLFIKKDLKILYVTTDQKPINVMQKIYSNLTGINVQKFQTNNFTDDEVHQIEIMQEIFNEYVNNLKIINTHSLGKIIAEQTQFEYDLVVIDWFQGINNIVTETSNTASVLAQFSKLAINTNCGIIIVSQLTKDVTRRVSASPILPDLPDTMLWESIAGIIVLLERVYKNTLLPKHYNLLNANIFCKINDSTELEFHLEPTTNKVGRNTLINYPNNLITKEQNNE